MNKERFDLTYAWNTTRDWAGSIRGTRVLLVAILIVGAYLRLSHVNWDMDTHIHPDERFLTMVEDALRLPSSIGEFFDSTKSPMSPYNTGHTFFVYGTLPIFIVKIVAELANRFNQVALLWTMGPDIPLDLVGYGGVHFVGRTLSGLFDLGCVWLIFLIGRRLYSSRVGLVASALLAFAVLPLQQSHFFTVDTFGTFFALVTFYFAVRVAQGGETGRHGGGWISYVALGASLGASVACRINLAPLAGIGLLAAVIRAWDDWHQPAIALNGAGRRRESVWLATLVQATLFRLALMALVAIAVFRIAQPYSFGGTSLLDFSLSPAWLSNMKNIQAQMSGAADVPPGIQWASRTPFVFPFVNMVVWGMGLPLGITAWVGWALAAWQVIRGFTVRTDATAVRRHLLPVTWIGGMFLWQGLQFVQSMRYLLPIYPLLAMMAAWFLFWLIDKARVTRGIALALPSGTGALSKLPASVRAWFERVRERVAGRQISPVALRRAAYALMGTVVIGTMLWGWAFLAIYRRPLSRVTASRWIYENVEPGSHIGNEHWDDSLPLRIDGKDGYGSFGLKGLSSSSDGNMQMYWEDTVEKREQLYQWLDEADYIVLSSNRLWGSIPRIPMRYPMSTLYYRLLFAGKLGFEEVLHETSFPTIFGIQFNDTGAEEAFSVYDHPEVRIFKKTADYSEANVRSYLDAVDLEDTIQMWPRQISSAPTALLMTDKEAEQQRAGGTWSDMFNLDGLLSRYPALAVVLWLLVIEILGLAVMPLFSRLLTPLADRGFGVGKTFGLLLFGWLSWFLPSLKILPYQRWFVVLLALILVAGGAWLGWRDRHRLLDLWRVKKALILTEEGVYLALFVLFLLIRFGNPDLWNPARGGEKPMDFAYLNAVIKSTTFPPYDPWYAGGFMNYYYFGFVIVGTLIKLTGILPWIAYNLAVPSLFALTGLGAFSVAHNLFSGDHRSQVEIADGSETEDDEVQPRDGLPAVPWRPLLAGLAATILVVIAGNLGNVKLLLDQFAASGTVAIKSGIPGLAKLVAALSGVVGWLTGKTPLSFPNDWWFWNASRVIPDTINEFPFFTFTYADLHAHMIALPLTLLGLALASALAMLPAREEGLRINPWRLDRRELALLGVLGFVVGALRATNTWDFPTYVLIGVAAVVVAQVQRWAHLGWPARPDELLGAALRLVVAIVWRTIVMVVVATIAFYPFTSNYATAYGGLQIYHGGTTSISEYLTVYGLFLALLIVYLISEAIEQGREGALPDWIQSALPAIAAATIVLIGVGWLVDAKIWLIALPLFAWSVLLAMGRSISSARRFALLLMALALAITMGVEVVSLKDDIGRMNTVFKFYMQAWVLFGVGVAFGFSHWVERSQSWLPGIRKLTQVVVALLFLGALLYAPTAARAKVADRFSAEDSPHGLDGMAYMDGASYFDNNRDLHLADDKAAMLWMLDNVEGSPVILEGNTPGYRWGNRFSIYTGLPAVMGWDWHEKQQRSIVPQAPIDRRLGHVREMYDSTDFARVRHLLDLYQVSYIVVGEQERAYYSAEGLAKFDRLVAQGYLEVAYDRGTVKLYQVVDRGAPLVVDTPSVVGPQPVPTITPPAISPDISPFIAPEDGELPSPEPFDSPQIP